MPHVEKLKIFLASPSDVPTERRHVKKVIDELNQTVADEKGVYFVLTSSENAFPGYGKDGQAILNEQIGKMQEYDLFIGIMWSRIGTPTPRAKSGTAEEFGRAIQALRCRKKPEVWFYFRLSKVRPPTTAEEVRQLGEVVAFRNKFREKGLFWEYETPAAFCDQLRIHLTLWLNQRQEKTPKSKSTAARSRQTEPKSKTESPVTSGRKKQTTPSTKTTTAKTTTAAKPSTLPRKAPASKNTSTRNTGVVKSPGDWVMLDGKFFQAKLTSIQPDRSILLQIPPKTMEQTAELKALHPGEFNHRRQIAFASSHEAGIMQVTSVTNESTAGKTNFSITLNPCQRSQNNGFAMETSFNNHSADEIAELRARLILLGQALPKELERFFPTQFYGPQNQPVILEKDIFPGMWTQLQTTQSQFLPKAWLWASYCLRMCQVIEDILELELGPIKNKVMPVRFRGKRKQVYSNQAASIISVVGNCILSA
jgi:hypothetical protein